MKRAIVIHLYYQDLWDEFLHKLKRLDQNFDLYVTMCVDNEDISDVIRQSFPSCVILRLPNKGLDIGPFLKVLEYMFDKNKEYDYLFKLHTKKSLHHNNQNTGIWGGIEWRTNLIDSLIGSPERFKLITEVLDVEKSVGLMTSKTYLMTESNMAWLENILQAFNIQPKYTYFAAGTMFVVRYSIFKEFFKDIDLPTLYGLMNDGYNRDLMIEHQMERMLSFIVTAAGYSVIGLKNVNE